jgi:hypothetical protein
MRYYESILILVNTGQTMWTLQEDLYVLHCASSVGQGILVLGVRRAYTCVCCTCSSACSVENVHHSKPLQGCVSSY